MFLSVREVHERLSGKVSLSTIYQLVTRGKLRGVKVAGRVLVEADSLDALLAAGRVEAVAPRRTERATMRRKYKDFSLD